MALTLGEGVSKAEGQEVGVRVGRFFSDSSDLNGLFLTVTRSPSGPWAVGFSLGRWKLRSPDRGTLYGAGADLQLLRGMLGSFYLLAGVEGGIGTRDASTVWGSWSGGLGWTVLQAGPLGLAIEGRYRSLSQGSRQGIEIGGHITIGVGRSDGSPREESASPQTVPRRRDVDIGAVGWSGVVKTALAAMGTPYQWGGSTANGFDCSGLVQYAYAEHGIRLPRRSVDQAASGVAVERDIGRLQPGDILTFATGDGNRASHVGLFIGEGRFIHSASTGVQVSQLTPDDPYGAWWFRRWVGARRIRR